MRDVHETSVFWRRQRRGRWAEQQSWGRTSEGGAEDCNLTIAAAISDNTFILMNEKWFRKYVTETFFSAQGCLPERVLYDGHVSLQSAFTQFC